MVEQLKQQFQLEKTNRENRYIPPEITAKVMITEVLEATHNKDDTKPLKEAKQKHCRPWESQGQTQ